LLWAEPRPGLVSAVEFTVLLSPKGHQRMPRVGSGAPIPVASRLAARRLLLLGYAHQLKVRTASSHGAGRTDNVALWDAYFDASSVDVACDMVRTGLRVLHRGSGWQRARPAPEMARAMWRATLLTNGVVAAAKPGLSIRALCSQRADNLMAAARVLDLNPALQHLNRAEQGHRIQFDDTDGLALLAHTIG
jgi:hypothetical protein